MTSVRHRSTPERHPDTSGGLKLKPCDLNSDRRTMSDKHQELRKSLNKSAYFRPGTGRCLSAHRTMPFRPPADVLWVELLLKAKNINTKIYMYWANLAFTSITVRASPSLSYYNNLFLWINDGEIDINVYIIALKNCLIPAKSADCTDFFCRWAP